LQGFVVTYVAKDVPDEYKKEIDATDWRYLTQKANKFLKEIIIPGVNSQLASGFQVPLVGQYLDSPELRFLHGYVFLGTSFKKH